MIGGKTGIGKVGRSFQVFGTVAACYELLSAVTERRYKQKLSASGRRAVLSSRSNRKNLDPSQGLRRSRRQPPQPQGIAARGRSAAEPQPSGLECADLSALLGGDWSPLNGEGDQLFSGPLNAALLWRQVAKREKR